MEATQTMTRIFSPKSYGSVLYAVLVHAAIYGGAVLILGLHLSKPEPVAEYVDMDYQTFDAPPAPAEKPQVVKRSPEPTEPVQKDVAPDNSPKEMQDEKSDVAGTQKAAKPEANIGSDNTGTAATTPYYKIKPKYPKAALLEGVEGWILLTIDVNEQGEVENVRISGGQPREMFGNEARRAVAQWKYKPFLDASGHPKRVTDHEVRVDFKLNEVESGS